jgi:SAM-dependent methyltransferase
MNKQLLEPKAIGSPPGVYKIVLEFLKESGAKRVLDCPAGEGLFAKILLDNKFDVACSDIYPGQFKLKEITCEFADLNDKLPYEDNTFDAVSCLNGLQRVWARGRAARELSRVVKPGGYVIISFPNNSDIRRRMLFMMTGSVTWNVIGPPNTCLPEAENPGACFRYPMTLANVLSAISSVGLKCESIRSTHYTKGAILLSPLILGPKLFSILSPKKYKDLYEMKQTSTLNALLGAFLVVIAKKPK